MKIAIVCAVLCAVGLAVPIRASDDAIPVTYSSRETDKTPATHVNFHGVFANDLVEASAESLPDHDFLDISFDLFILRSWDGSVPVNAATKKSRLGPDYFILGTADGPFLLYTTFSNWPDERFTNDSRFQNYPSQIPGEHLDSYAGCDARNTLGYHYGFPGPPQPVPMDSTYHMHFVIPHSSSQFILQLSAYGLSSVDDENWGFTDVKLKTLHAKDIQTPDDKAIADAFAESLDSSSTKRPAAFQTLILGMDKTADWITKNVKPQPIDAATVHQLIDDLLGDDNKIDARASAGASLYALGPQIEPYLRDARKSAHSEQRLRIDRVLTQIGVNAIDDPDLARAMLATRVLEIIGTTRALEVRAALTESK